MCVIVLPLHRSCGGGCCIEGPWVALACNFTQSTGRNELFYGYWFICSKSTEESKHRTHWLKTKRELALSNETSPYNCPSQEYIGGSASLPACSCSWRTDSLLTEKLMNKILYNVKKNNNKECINNKCSITISQYGIWKKNLKISMMAKTEPKSQVGMNRFPITSFCFLAKNSFCLRWW